MALSAKRRPVEPLGIPEIVRKRALTYGASAWLDALPALVAEMERDWSLAVGRTCTGGTEGYVAEATLGDGARAVLKLAPPGDATSHEILAMGLADGRGCARVLRSDPARGAMLLERLGPSLHDLGRPYAEREEILCATVRRVWRPAPGCGLPTGAAKGRWLADFVAKTWEELGRPCSETVVLDALACAARRVAAHDDERAVLVHGDAHAWNALQAADGFKFVDADGLLAEPEYDLGVLMREDPDEGDLRERALRLAARTGLDATAVWEWGVVERVASGLMCTHLDLQPAGREMLAAAERVVP